MAQDEGKQEEKFDFTSEGEALSYISLDQARVLAMRTARESPGSYGRRFADVPMAFEAIADEETEDHYVVTLSFRPEGAFAGTPGREQFFIEKEGNVAVRQVLSLPGRVGWRRIPLSLVVVGLVVVVAAAVGGVFAATGGGDGPDDSSPQVAALPTSTPVPTTSTLVPAPTTATATAIALPVVATATPAALAPTTTLPPLPPGVGLTRGGSISGVVTDAESGRPLANVLIAVNPLDKINGTNYQSQGTDGSGRYMLMGVEPGQYHLRPDGGTEDYIPVFYNDAPSWDTAEMVTVTAGETVEGIDFALKRGAKVSGKVRDGATGLPIPNMRVSTGVAETLTDSQGEYTVRGVPDGEIVVLVEGQGYGKHVKTITVTGGQDVTGVDF